MRQKGNKHTWRFWDMLLIFAQNIYGWSLWRESLSIMMLLAPSIPGWLKVCSCQHTSLWDINNIHLPNIPGWFWYIKVCGCQHQTGNREYQLETIITFSFLCISNHHKAYLSVLLPFTCVASLKVSLFPSCWRTHWRAHLLTRKR